MTNPTNQLSTGLRFEVLRQIRTDQHKLDMPRALEFTMMRTNLVNRTPIYIYIYFYFIHHAV